MKGVEIVYFLDFREMWVHFDIVAEKIFKQLKFFVFPVKRWE